MRVAIDAGHGWTTPGKRTPKFTDGSFMQEFAFNAVVADKLKYLLNNSEIETYLTYDPSGEKDYKYNNRVGMANSWGADLYVSIHANAIGNGVDFNNSHGILFLANEKDTRHIQLGQTIIDELEKIYPYNRTLYWIPGYFGQSLCKYSKMPTAIIECGFMTNIRDAELLANNNYRTDCANAIYSGLIKYAIDNNILNSDEIGKVEIMNKAIRAEALKAIEELHLTGFIGDVEYWKNYNLTDSMPAWAVFILINRLRRDIYDVLDKVDKIIPGSPKIY